MLSISIEGELQREGIKLAACIDECKIPKVVSNCTSPGVIGAARLGGFVPAQSSQKHF